MNAQLKSIVAHITFIGWIVALIVNNSQKDELTSFFIRQTLGIHLIFAVGSLIPRLNFIFWIVAFVLWIISLISAINQERKEVPGLGSYFQDWFRSIG